MNVAHNISQLLYRYQCVTVPGFGAFLSENLPANIQESNQTFYPPKKVISFNSYLKNNDGLLANHVAVSEKMSYELAVNAIEKQVNQWKIQLQHNETVSLKNIGNLQYNSENNLIFESYKNINYLSDSFGLVSFVSPEIKREINKKELEAFIETPVISINPEKRNYVSSYFKYAAVLLVSLGGAGLAYSNYISNLSQTETLLVQTEVQKEVETKIQEATFFINTPSEPMVMNVKEKNFPFHIVAGAFQNEENAQQYFEKLISKGFEAKILNKNNHGLIPVIYGSFPSYGEAQDKANEIKKTINKEAWVLIKEL